MEKERETAIFLYNNIFEAREKKGKDIETNTD
jgi:hypothetical protein